MAVSGVNGSTWWGTGSPLLGTRPSGRIEGGSESFGEVLKNALAEVNDWQLKADQGAMEVASGRVEDLHEVVLTAEKADLSLQLALQIRNKILEAYQEIMRMPL